MNWFTILLFSALVPGYFSVQKQSLDGVWTLNESNGAYVNLVASVPGGIYTDLMRNNIIDDPTLEDNDQKYKWVGRKNWTYAKHFAVDKDILEYSNLNIVFEGLDTISTIFLNGKQIGSSSNMFVRYIFNIKDVLKEGDNYLEVKFVSPVITAERFASIQNQSYSVPPECPDSVYRGECHINELRKMQASFSWDWGPTLASVGIWKHVFLEGFNSSVIRYCVVETEEISSTSSWQVSIVTFLSGNVKNSVDGKLVLKLKTDNEDTVTLIVDVNAQPDGNNNIEVRQNVQIRQGSVKRWWPNGYGEQPLYDITVTFYSENELDTFSHRIGYRTIELVQEEVKISQANYGNSFYFKVNGIPIFAKGSNAIPINILPEKGQEKESVDKLLQSARDCHMNMLRVWGGGVYESDYYYQRADEFGIMIWQDFMFACALYPSRQDFLDNVIQEVRHQVKRIGSHPSVVMWAGNNENEAAIHGNWYGSNGKQIYFDDYKKLYFGTIKPEFQKILKRGQYIGSSPSNGVESEAEGGISNNPYDEHYGDVHTYIYELDGFNPNIYPIPRFSSEYGFQSYPSFSTFLKASKNKSNLVIGSEFLQHRQHHPFGDAQLELEVLYQMELPDEKSPNYTDVFIFYTQIYQAVSIKTQTERYRKH
ncbi:hypothetical protein WA026_016651, partial [Henosepilachna vigintioctopunctata]